MVPRPPSLLAALLLPLVAAAGQQPSADSAARRSSPPPAIGDDTSGGRVRDHDRPLARTRDDEDAWVAKWRDAEWRQSGFRLAVARTYNRTEGLPIVLGPLVRRDYPWGRLSAEAFGILRTSEGWAWNERTTGFRTRAEVRLGRGRGVALGVRTHDVAEAVEPWQLSDGENGLAAFFAQRDYRDWFDRHGGHAVTRLFALDGALALSASHGRERWGSRAVHDVYALARRPNGWRDNPGMDDGVVSLTTLDAVVDTRNDPDDPTSGWYVSAAYERGAGTLTPAPTSPGVRPAAGGPARVRYGRSFLDLRRYNRLAPGAEVRLRIVAGGWTDGDPLPLQRRLSLSGPGAMPAFPFRGGNASPWLECASGSVPAGSPAQCDRLALAQVEYRGVMQVGVADWMGITMADPGARSPGRPRRTGWSSRTRGAFVVFADAGRGWLVRGAPGDSRVSGGFLPPLGTFRADLGGGVEFGTLGFYIAKAVDGGSREIPPIFFLRFNRRF